jgi:hypothetical protein
VYAAFVRNIFHSYKHTVSYAPDVPINTIRPSFNVPVIAGQLYHKVGMWQRTLVKLSNIQFTNKCSALFEFLRACGQKYGHGEDKGRFLKSFSCERDKNYCQSITSLILTCEQSGFNPRFNSTFFIQLDMLQQNIFLKKKHTFSRIRFII